MLPDRHVWLDSVQSAKYIRAWTAVEQARGSGIPLFFLNDQH